MTKDEHPDLQRHLDAGGGPEAGPCSILHQPSHGTAVIPITHSPPCRETIAAHSCEMDVKIEEKAESKGGTVLKSKLMDG